MTSLLSLDPGIYKNISAEDYHARVPGMANKTALDQVDRSPQHLKAWLDGADREATPAMLFGSALHCALLEPEVYLKTYIVEPEWGDCRKTENKQRRDSWRMLNKGKKLLTSEDAAAIHGMFQAVHRHPLAGKMVRDGVAEATLRWKDEETGLHCKARADYYVEALHACFDVKSTEDARPEAFARSVANYRYHVQHAFYAEGFRAIGQPLQHFVFIAVEKKPPYALALYTLDALDVATGWNHCRRNLNTMRECYVTGVYPGYETGIQTLRLPAWAK